MCKVLRSLIVLGLSLSNLGCLSFQEELEKASLSTHDIWVQITNKAGVPYPNISLEARKGSLASEATADGSGNILYSLPEGTFDLITAGSVPSRPYVYAKNDEYEAQITVSEGVSSYSAIFREAVFLDLSAVSSSGTRPIVTTETQFAVAITLSAQTDFCSAGIGISFGHNYIPAGTHVSIHANSGGEPNSSALFDSSDLSHSSLIVPTNRETGGMTGNFCDNMNPVQTLAAGTYWIVATFQSPPNACVSGHCFHVLGTTSANDSGLPVKVSSDGGASWATKTFTAGGETRQSLSAFLLE